MRDGDKSGLVDDFGINFRTRSGELYAGDIDIHCSRRWDIYALLDDHTIQAVLRRKAAQLAGIYDHTYLTI